MNTPEAPQCLETVEAVAGVLQAIIDEAKKLLADSQCGPITMIVPLKDPNGRHIASTIETVPNGDNKGTVIHLTHTLQDIRLQDMRSDTALHAALVRICGPRRHVTAEDINKNSYLVGLIFTSGVNADCMPINEPPAVILRKIARTWTVLEEQASVYQKMLDEATDCSPPNANITSSDQSIEVRRAFLAKNTAAIEAGLRETRDAQTDDTRDTFSIWLRTSASNKSARDRAYRRHILTRPVYVIKVPQPEGAVDALNAVTEAVASTNTDLKAARAE